jgi:hypothetical protein
LIKYLIKLHLGGTPTKETEYHWFKDILTEAPFTVLPSGGAVEGKASGTLASAQNANQF